MLYPTFSPSNPERSPTLRFSGTLQEIKAAGGHIAIVRSRVQQGDLISIAAGTLSFNAQGRIDGELQMMVAVSEKVIPALRIEKMLEEGVPQATLDCVAPGVKTQDLNNLFGALDRRTRGWARSSSRTPTPASPRASRCSARRRSEGKKVPSRCASSTARCFSGR